MLASSEDGDFIANRVARYTTGASELSVRSCAGRCAHMNAVEPPVILFLCTGNAARSVMGAAILRQLSDQVVVTSAGTHSLPGLPMSSRTRTALEGVNASDPKHLSAQVDQAMVDEAALVVIFEPMHLRYMRKEHPSATDRTASLPRLARDLASGPFGGFVERIAALDLADHDFESWEEVVDPAGGELPVFEDAARMIDAMVRQLAVNLGLDSGAAT